MNWKDEGMTRDARGYPQTLRTETVSSLMQKMKISEEKAKQLIEKVKLTGHL
jgi:hypothetical protein